MTELIRSSFKNWRKMHRITLRECEAKTGLSNAFLSQFENGLAKNISLENAEKIVKLILENQE